MLKTKSVLLAIIIVSILSCSDFGVIDNNHSLDLVLTPSGEEIPYIEAKKVYDLKDRAIDIYKSVISSQRNIEKSLIDHTREVWTEEERIIISVKWQELLNSVSDIYLFYNRIPGNPSILARATPQPPPDPLGTDTYYFIKYQGDYILWHHIYEQHYLWPWMVYVHSGGKVTTQYMPTGSLGTLVGVTSNYLNQKDDVSNITKNSAVNYQRIDGKIKWGFFPRMHNTTITSRIEHPYFGSVEHSQ